MRAGGVACWSDSTFGEPNVLTEPLRNLAELHRAVLRLKMHKRGDDMGLTVECQNMLQHITALCLDGGAALM